MAKCKEALDQAGGNMDEAIAILGRRGLMSAAKKEGRATKEGMVIAAQEDESLPWLRLMLRRTSL